MSSFQGTKTKRSTVGAYASKCIAAPPHNACTAVYAFGMLPGKRQARQQREISHLHRRMRALLSSNQAVQQDLLRVISIIAYLWATIYTPI